VTFVVEIADNDLKCLHKAAKKVLVATTVKKRLRMIQQVQAQQNHFWETNPPAQTLPKVQRITKPTRKTMER
jgi:hypothetical protein